MKGFITLFADASFCPRTKAYGWCFWMKHGQPPVTVVRDGNGQGIRNSEDAELVALQEGLVFVRTIPFEDRVIVVESDCTGALFRIRSEFGYFRERGAKNIIAKHVKGHQGTRNPRAAVNTTCDRRARNRMIEVRDQLLREVV